MSKIIDNFEAMLVAKADQNKDGLLDKKDVALIAQRARAQIISETQKFPTAMLIAAFAVGAVLGFFIAKL